MIGVAEVAGEAGEERVELVELRVKVEIMVEAKDITAEGI